MIKTILFILLTLSFYITIIAQSTSYIYQGDKKYKSTESWPFQINGDAWDVDLWVSIGKDDINGIIMLETGVTPDSYIGGPIYLFLSDGSKITCSDKNIKDNVDNKTVVIYKINAKEVEMLKENYIETIRFTIQPSYFIGFNGNKTASNTIDPQHMKYPFDFKNNYYKTDVAVTELYQLR